MHVRWVVLWLNQFSCMLTLDLRHSLLCDLLSTAGCRTRFSTGGRSLLECYRLYNKLYAGNYS